MNDKERRQIVKSIDEDFKIFEEREQKRREFRDLKETEILKKYFSLQEEIINLNKELKEIGNNKEKIIPLKFCQTIGNRKIFERFSDCTHPIWIYLGSFKDESEYGYQSRVYSKKVDNENSYDFEYNMYRCLECGKKEIIRKWEIFEKNNFILKSYKKSFYYYDYFNELQNEYYNYLYKHTIDTSKKKLIKSFNDKNGSR